MYFINHDGFFSIQNTMSSVFQSPTKKILRIILHSLKFECPKYRKIIFETEKPFTINCIQISNYAKLCILLGRLGIH